MTPIDDLKLKAKNLARDLSAEFEANEIDVEVVFQPVDGGVLLSLISKSATPAVINFSTLQKDEPKKKL
jgi:hypothetical protein